MITQIIKFGLVGFLCFFIDYGVLYFMTELLGIYYLVSSAVSFSLSVIVNYILSMKYVFESRNTNKLKEFIIFVWLSLFGLGINQFLMWFCVEILNVYYLISKILATAIVMIYNFVTRKLILEKK